jgi:uracil-DNA glycosylase
MGNAAGLEALKEYLRFLMENDLFEFPCSSGDPIEGGKPRSSGGDRICVQNSPELRLSAIRAELGDCRRCPLSRGRGHIVFGEGNPNAEIVFVGEGPGSEEDRSGRPFVGRAGQLLTRIIENAMATSRQDVYICNIVKCRPPGNRAPKEEEVQACLSYLEKQIDAIRPRVIVTLGQPAACALLRLQSPIHLLRGRWQIFQGIPLMPTFHPSYVLRQYTVQVRKQVFEDMQEVMRLLERKESRPPGI